MNKIKNGLILIIILIISVNYCYAGITSPQTNFEKGDLLITDGAWIFRHIAIFSQWAGGNPYGEYLNNYKIIEENGNHSLEGYFALLHPEKRLYMPLWGARGLRVPVGIYKPGMSYDQRNRIINWARSKLNLPYTFFPEHKKNRLDIQCGWFYVRILRVEAYRCDGFCEAAYESVGLDPTPRFFDNAWMMTPVTFGIYGGMFGYHYDYGKGFKAIENQNLSGGPKLSLITEDKQLKLRVIEDQSGISLLEIWKWTESAAPNLSEYWDADAPPNGATCIGLDMNEYDYDHNYSLASIGTGNVYARAYDQAGNFSTIKLAIQQLNGINTANILANSSAEPPQVIIDNINDQDNVEENPKIQVSIIKKENPINYNQIFLSIDEGTPTYSIQTSQFKTSSLIEKDQLSFNLKALTGKELSNGIHTIKVTAADTNGNLGSQQVSIKVSSVLDIEKVLNYPNPAGTSGTTFYYKLTKQADSGKIIIFNTSGKKVKEFSGIPVNLGKNEIAYNCTDEYGDYLANGVYFYFLELRDSDGKTIRQKGKIAIIK